MGDALSKEDVLEITKKFDLRSDKTKTVYQKFIKTNKKKNCIFCDKELLLKEFDNWVILKNRFPYDKIAELSHMLTTKRHVSGEENLTLAELYELRQIKKKHLKKYDALLEATPQAMTKPEHYHLHIIRYHRKK